MKSLNAAIDALKRAGADASRVKIADGRSYTTVNIRGFGWTHVIAAAIAGGALIAGVAVVTLWLLGFTLATSTEAALVRAVNRVPWANNVLMRSSDAELAARMGFDDGVVHYLGEVLKGDGAAFTHAASNFAAGFPEGERAYAISRLIDLSRRTPASIENAEKIAKAVDERQLASLAALAVQDREFLIGYLGMSHDERAAARHVAAAVRARSPVAPRLGAVIDAVISGWDFRSCALPPLYPVR